MTLLRTCVLAASIAAASACESPTSPEVQNDSVRVNGTMFFSTLEGGFWALRGDDGVTYTPRNGVGQMFLRENLRVSMVGRIRRDLGGRHMVGPIVDVISLRPFGSGLSTGFPTPDTPTYRR
jgi:hypothetical protein